MRGALAGLCLLLGAEFATGAGSPFVLHRDAWTFNRSKLDFFGTTKPDEQKASGVLKEVAGWTEYDFELPQGGWYELWEKGWNPEWTRTISIDGQPVLWHAVSSPRDEDKAFDGFKEANFWLAAGKHTIRFQRVTWPGDLPDAWELRAAGDDPAGCLRALPRENIVRVGEPAVVKFLGGTRIPTTYEFFLSDATGGEKFPVGKIEFPATDRPLERELKVTYPRQGTFSLEATSGGKSLRPSDIKVGMTIAVDTKSAPVPPAKLVTKRVIEIDCAAAPPPGEFWEKDGKTRVVNAPFGAYRESSGLGRGVDGYWGTDGFSYRVKLPAVDQLYRLRVEYPDDDRRSMGFWINDGSEPKSNAAAIVNTGGVETGDQYRLTHKMQVHESFFYPQAKDEVIVAVINLVPSMKAAAARITIDLVESGLPAAPLGEKRGREVGFYFEESGRWRKFFGGDNKKGIQEDLRTLERWGQWNRYFGANLMFPTINVYQANHYPSHILDGYFSRPFNEVRLAALVAEKYQQELVPEFHLTGQDWFDREVMGVWEEKRKEGGREISEVKFASPAVEETIIRDRDGNTKYCYEPFVYNALNPVVQEKYISILGELADTMKDCRSFSGISSRMMFTWQWQGWNALPNLNWGYDDWTIGYFEKETGIKVPGQAGDARRFRERFNFLTGHERRRWIQWRCDKIHQYHQRMLARIQQAKPGARLVFNWFPLDERQAQSTDMLEQMEEVGMDWHTYAKERDIVVIPPAATYGRRFSIPTSDASKVDGLYDASLQTVGRFAGRAYGIYSDYYEVNRNMNWADLGGKPFAAFDASLPSDVNERGIYAQAMADCDTGFFANGGSGWIFGTPSLLQGFMREYRALPAVPFDAWDKARDPVAVWSHRETDGTFWFYAVNRLPVAVNVTITLSGGDVCSAVDGAKIELADGGKLPLKLEPFMLRAFRAGKDTQLSEIRVDVPPEFVDSIRPMLAFAAQMRKDLLDRSIVPELSGGQVAEAIACFDGAASAFSKGEYFHARGLLERLAAVQIYYLSGKFPPGLWQRSKTHGLPELAPPAHVIAGEGLSLDTITDISFDGQGNLWASAGERVLKIDRGGKLSAAYSLFEPYELLPGDIRKPTLQPGRPLAATSLKVGPDGNLVVQSSVKAPLRYESRTGRLIDLPSKLFPPSALPVSFLAVTANNETLLSCATPGWQGIYLCSPDGTLDRKFADREALAGAVDGSGRIYLSRPDGLEVLSLNGGQPESISAPGFSRLAVSRDGGSLLGLESKSNALSCFRRTGTGALSLAWRQVLPTPVAGIALAASGQVALGFKSPDRGALARFYNLGQKGLEGGRDALMAETIALDGETRLKVFEGNLYYASRGKLMRLTPGQPDKLEVAYDPGFKDGSPAFEAFAFDPNGDLYLASHWNGKARGVNVFVCRREGGKWSAPEALNQGAPLWAGNNVAVPDLEVDAQGGMIVRLNNPAAKGQNCSIYRWTPDGGSKLLADLGDAPLDADYGLAKVGDDVIVAGGDTRKIMRLHNDGSVVWKLDRLKSSPPGYADLRSPVGVASDSAGNLKLTDPERNQILDVSSTGELRGAVGTFGNGGLQFNRPSGVAVVKDTRGAEWIYVADAGNRRIVKWPLAK